MKLCVFTACFEVLKTYLGFVLLSFCGKDGKEKKVTSVMTIKTRHILSPTTAASDSVAVTVMIARGMQLFIFIK